MTEWEAFQEIAYYVLVPVMPWGFGLGLAAIIVLFIGDVIASLLYEYIKGE